MSEMKDMWRCPTPNCGYIYDPDRGDRRHHILEPNSRIFRTTGCPVCGASKRKISIAFRTKSKADLFRNRKGSPKAAFSVPPAWACPDGEKSENGKKYLRAGLACQAGVYAIG